MMTQDTPITNETARRKSLLERRLEMTENTLIDLGYASEQEQEIAKVLKISRKEEIAGLAKQTKEWLVVRAFVQRKLAELAGELPTDETPDAPPA
jgi:hypothetical protein